MSLRDDIEAAVDGWAKHAMAETYLYEPLHFKAREWLIDAIEAAMRTREKPKPKRGRPRKTRAKTRAKAKNADDAPAPVQVDPGDKVEAVVSELDTDEAAHLAGAQWDGDLLRTDKSSAIEVEGENEAAQMAELRAKLSRLRLSGES